MKKIFLSTNKIAVLIASVFLTAMVFSACKKSTVEPSRTPAAGLMAVNLIPNAGALGVAVGGNSMTPQALYFNNYTGGYRGVHTGERMLETYNFGSGSTIAKAPQMFKDSAFYSLFVMGANDVYSHVFVEDKLQNLPQDDKTKTYVRFVNAIPDSTNFHVTVSSGDNRVFDEAAHFKTVSAFKAVPSGEVAVSISNGLGADVSRTITLDKGKIYTVLLSGLPQTSNDDFKLSIRFITNATL